MSVKEIENQGSSGAQARSVSVLLAREYTDEWIIDKQQLDTLTMND
jgi:hypothetical protein